MKKKKQMGLFTFLMVLFAGVILTGRLFESFVDFVHGFLSALNGEDVPPTALTDNSWIKTMVWVISGLLVVLVYIILKRRINSPIKKLSEGMSRVQEGNLDTEIEATDGFEFGKMEEGFNSMVKGLREAREYQEEMAEKNRKLYAEIAHDLKTPMTMILGYAKLLADGNVPEDKKNEYILTITEQTQNANSLLEQMLEYAKLGSTEYKLEFKEYDLAECLRLAVSDSYIRFEEKNMSLDVDIPDEPVILEYDERQIKRVIYNLLGNAINHNPDGTAVSVRMSLKDKDSSDVNSNPIRKSVEIIIADNGPLIDPDLKESLFDPFKTGDESRSKSGSGLGLAVAKKIVERHNGTLEYNDSLIPGFKAFVVTI